MASTSPELSLEQEVVLEGWTKVGRTRVNVGSNQVRSDCGEGMMRDAEPLTRNNRRGALE
jgi:hypothetical protein